MKTPPRLSPEELRSKRLRVSSRLVNHVSGLGTFFVGPFGYEWENGDSLTDEETERANHGLEALGLALEEEP